MEQTILNYLLVLQVLTTEFHFLHAQLHHHPSGTPNCIPRPGVATQGPLSCLLSSTSIDLRRPLSNGSTTEPQLLPGPKLVIDHDGGADDSMAIFMACLYQKYFNGPQLIGLTTVNGNVNESQVFENSQRILDIADRQDVPIYRGSERSLVISIPSDFYFGHDGLGDLENVDYEAKPAESEQAALALIELSKKYPGDLTVIAIGPVTNIAMAIRLDPGFIDRLSQLYVGAGNINSEEHPEREFNAEMDVEAYKIVAESAKTDKVTIAPFTQVKSSLNISLEWRIEVLGAIPTKIMQAQNGFERLSLAASKAWHNLDPAVAAIALDADVVEEYRDSENDIILCGEQRGINTNNFSSTTSNTRLVYSYNYENYKELLIKIFSEKDEYNKEGRK